MTSITSLKSINLDLPPSCIEFWPLNPKYAVVGTYNLEKTESSEENPSASEPQSQERNGSLILLEVDDTNIKIVQKLPTPFAIFDIHFKPPDDSAHDSTSLLAAATSTGSIATYNVIKQKYSPPQLRHEETYHLFPASVLVTAFAWHPHHAPPSPPTIGATLSTGEVAMCTLRKGSSTSNGNPNNSSAEDPDDLITYYTPHAAEAWTLAFTHSGQSFYTGGDDSAINFSQNTTIQSTQPPNPSPATWSDRKLHTAGVTAILPLELFVPEIADLIITGSYDDHIRLIHAPSLGRRTVLAELNLGGGVWRLKRLDLDHSTPEPAHSSEQTCIWLLASCMHAGARIIRLVKDGKGEWGFEVVKRFEEHKSMCYGCDWREEGKGEILCVSTSFYDRLVCVWTIGRGELVVGLES